MILTRDDNALFEQAAASPNPPFVIDLTGAGRKLGEHRLHKAKESEAERIEANAYQWAEADGNNTFGIPDTSVGDQIS